MTRAQDRRAEREFVAPPSFRVAGVVGGVVFLLYLATLAPTIGLWDAGEYTAAAARLGIPHPPGNPGYVLFGRVVSMLPIARTVAARLNVMVALASALSAGIWFLVAEHVSRKWLTDRRAQFAGAGAALIGATAFTVWNQSVVNEKVYTISLLLLSLDLWTALRWQTEPDGRAADRRLALICYRLGIGYTIHIAGLLAGPAVLAAVLYTRPRTLLRKQFMLACGVLFVLGLSPFIALPIRAAFRLEINEGHPSACEDGKPHWGCTVSQGTLDRFLYEHNRTQYAKPPLTERQQTLPNQVKMWWLYFKWQWFRDPTSASPESQSALAVLILLLAGVGGYAHARYDRRSFVPFATLMATLIIGLIYYLNFKLGYSQALAMGVRDPAAQEVRDRDYFYLWSFSALSVWIGLGVAYAWRRVAEFASGGDEEDDVREPREQHWRLAALVWIVVALPLVLNWRAASRRGQTFAEDYAIDMLNSIEPNGVLFTGGDNDSFPLWFVQQVLGVRRDVSVVLLPYLSTDWYPRELIARSFEPYDAARGPAVYRGMSAAVVTTPLLKLTRQEADSIPPHVTTFEARNIELPGFSITVPAGAVPRDAVFMLRIIQDAGPHRPIYFSRGAGLPAIGELLRSHMITQGLARKLVANPKDLPGSVPDGSDGFIDVPRTLALWRTYRAPDGLEHYGIWVDAPSGSTPYMYLRLGTDLANALATSGDVASKVAVNMQLERVVSAIDFRRVLDAQSAALEAPAGLGYAPVTGR